MKSLLIIASFIALAVASPTHRGIEAGPAILDFEPIAVDPAIVDVDPFAVSPSNVDVEVNDGPGTSLIQIVVNIHGTITVTNGPINVYGGGRAIVAKPDQVAEAAPESVQDIETDPAILYFEPIAVGPAFVDVNPFAGSPAQVDVEVTGGSGPSLIQVIVNIDGTTTVTNAPIDVFRAARAFVAERDQAAEAAPEPVQVIETGPSISDFKPSADVDPFAGSPARVNVKVNDGPGTSLIQIIVNIDGTTTVTNAPINVYRAGRAVVAEPDQVAEAAPEPVQVIEVAPEPIQVVEAAPVPIGTPVLPMPVGPEVNPEPIVIGTPQLPIPVVVLPELN